MPLLADAMKLDLVKLVIFLGIMGIVTLRQPPLGQPIYRFERSAQILQGDHPPVSLRPATT